VTKTHDAGKHGIMRLRRIPGPHDRRAGSILGGNILGVCDVADTVRDTDLRVGHLPLDATP